MVPVLRIKEPFMTTTIMPKKEINILPEMCLANEIAKLAIARI